MKKAFLIVALSGLAASITFAGPTFLAGTGQETVTVQEENSIRNAPDTATLVKYIMNDVQACVRLGWGNTVLQSIPVLDDNGEPVLDKNLRPVVDFEVVDSIVFRREAWNDREAREYTHGDLARIFLNECWKANAQGYVKFRGFRGVYKEQRLSRKYLENQRASGPGNGKKFAQNDFTTFVNEVISIWMSPYEIRKVVNRNTGETRVIRTIPPGHRSIAQCILEADKNFNQSPEPFTKVRYKRTRDMGWVAVRKRNNWRKEVDDMGKTDSLGLPNEILSTIGVRHLPAPRLEGLQVMLEREHRNRVRDCLEAAEVINPKFRFVLEQVLKGYTPHQIIEAAEAKYPEAWQYGRKQFWRDCKELAIKREDLAPEAGHMTQEQMTSAIAEMRAARKG